MATSIVKVYNTRRGCFAQGQRVALGWDDNLMNIGISKNHFTDKNGKVEIEHGTVKGIADVYVNGQKRGEMRTPGSETIEI
jgi:hypothetical protein